MDISRGEAMEKELDGLIRRRHDARVRDEGERREEELWRESERRHAEMRSRQNRAAWADYHAEQAARHRAVLEGLVGYHEERAQRYGHHQREEDSSC